MTMISENIKQSIERFFGSQPKTMVRTTDPDTSMVAAKKVDSTKLEQMVYEAIAKYPNGCISDEIQTHFPNHGVQTISPRYAPLIRKGFIEDTGERRVGLSGRSQRVLKVIK
jgi:myo-inositol-1-phosphate synthase